MNQSISPVTGRRCCTCVALTWWSMQTLSTCNPTLPPLQLDLSRGILAAVPGWAHVRLLAPHADVRLLVCGQSTLVDSHRLRCTAAACSRVDG